MLIQSPSPATRSASLQSAGALRLRVLSYNMQVGLQTSHYGHYLTRAWRHALPGPGMHRRLDQLAELLRDYDFVALQEADAGSLRTQYVNQVEYLAKRADFAHWGLSITRDLRPMACHALAYLSRVAPVAVDDHILPSLLPGRRALRVDLGAAAGGLQILVAHLSLSRGAQHLQLDYLNRLMPPNGPVLLMGDLNCEAALLRRHASACNSRLCIPEPMLPSYPSWLPRRGLDHLLHTAEIKLQNLQVLPYAVSDHLPLSAELLIETQRG